MTRPASSRLPPRLTQVALLGTSLLGLWLALRRVPAAPPDLAYDPTVLPITLASLGLMLAAAVWSTPWRRSALLFGLAVSGHASALHLIDAPRYAVYQHILPWSEILARPVLLLSILTVQTIVCLVLAIQAWPRVSAVVRRFLRPWQWTIVAGVLAASIVVPTMSLTATLEEWATAVWLSLTPLVNLALVAFHAPSESVQRAVTWIGARLTITPNNGGERRWDRLFPWIAAAWVVILAGAVSWYVLDGVPHIDDSISNYFQAKYFSTGQLYLPAPPDSASFHVAETVVDGTKWFGYGFPGWPAVLALGVLAGLPWLVNPLLGGAALLVAHRLLRSLYGSGFANLATALLSLSPWLLFTSASFMGHSAALTWGLVALFAADRVARGKGWEASGWAALAGLGIGLLFLTRPVEGLFVGTVAALWILACSRPLLRAVGATAVFGIVSGTVSGLLFLYNAALTGRATYAPHMMWTDRTWGPGVDRLGFGPDIGIPAWSNIDPLPGHGLLDVILNLNKNAFMANVELFGWAFGSLVFVVLACVVLRPRRQDWLMLGLLGIIVVGHSAYWFSGGPDLGPRYWYAAILPFVVLTIRGTEAAAARLATPGQRQRLGVFIAAATLSAAFAFLPWRSVTKHYRYREIGGEVRNLAAQHGFGRALVFVDSPNREARQSAFNFNPPTLDDPSTIYATDAGKQHRETVIRHFSDRPIWVLGRSGGPDTRLEVLGGPFPPGIDPLDHE